jgi:hypothetical protein
MGSERSPKLVDIFLRLCPRMIVAEFDVWVNVMEKATYNEVGQFSDEAQVMIRGCERYDMHELTAADCGSISGQNLDWLRRIVAL